MKIYGLAFTVTLCLIFSRIDSSIIHGLKLQENTNTEKTPRKSIEIIREEDEDEGGVASVVYSNFVKAPEIIAVSETMDEPPSPPFRTSDGAPFAIDQIKGDFHEHEKDITCLRNKKICSLEPDTGRCKAAFPRYYYDFEKKECIPFIYGGCMGNENNFKTLEECQKKCYC